MLGCSYVKHELTLENNFNAVFGGKESEGKNQEKKVGNKGHAIISSPKR